LNVLHTELIQTRSHLARIGQRRGYEVEQLEKQKKRMVEIEEEKTQLVKAVALIDGAIGVISANGIGKIETTVTNGLRLVFNDQDLAFKIFQKTGTQGNKYYIEVQKGDHGGPILETFGGGIANVVSFLLRVIMVKRFKLPKLMVCDENFNNVSAKVLPQVSEMLRSLTADSGYTILAVTHSPILASAADHVYKVDRLWNQNVPSLRRLTAQQKAEIKNDGE
jgi:DNA repair ATPase RecN